MSSTFFESHGFNRRKTVVNAVLYGTFTPMHVNIQYKNFVYSFLPEDGQMRFETWRRRPKLKN